MVKAGSTPEEESGIERERNRFNTIHFWNSITYSDFTGGRRTEPYVGSISGYRGDCVRLFDTV